MLNTDIIAREPIEERLINHTQLWNLQRITILTITVRYVLSLDSSEEESNNEEEEEPGREDKVDEDSEITNESSFNKESDNKGGGKQQMKE